jgi:outer membrane biogenesis lipoprotein LolB
MTRTFSLVPALRAGALLGLACLLLSGCATFSHRYVVRDFCELAPNLKAHRKDTDNTQRELDNYRELYRRRCPDGKWR